MSRLFLGLLAALAIAATPGVALSDHLDVLQTKLNEGCTMDTYLAIVRDFNDYYESRGYQAEILVPIAAQSQDSFFWRKGTFVCTNVHSAFNSLCGQLAFAGSRQARGDRPAHPFRPVRAIPWT